MISNGGATDMVATEDIETMCATENKEDIDDPNRACHLREFGVLGGEPSVLSAARTRI